MKRKSAADELVEAMREAAAVAQREAEPAAVHRFPLPLDVDVRAIRAARAYLIVIARHPQAVVEALAS